MPNCLGEFGRAKQLLEDHPDIDILYKDGIYFTFVLSDNNAEMLDVLLQYFERTNLTGDRESFGIKTAKYKLRTAIQEELTNMVVVLKFEEY